MYHASFFAAAAQVERAKEVGKLYAAQPRSFVQTLQCSRVLRRQAFEKIRGPYLGSTHVRQLFSRHGRSRSQLIFRWLVTHEAHV